jgi:hypothetical protein
MAQQKSDGGVMVFLGLAFLFLLFILGIMFLMALGGRLNGKDDQENGGD